MHSRYRLSLSFPRLAVDQEAVREGAATTKVENPRDGQWTRRLEDPVHNRSMTDFLPQFRLNNNEIIQI